MIVFTQRLVRPGELAATGTQKAGRWHARSVSAPTRDERDAALAAVLAQAVRDGTILPTML